MVVDNTDPKVLFIIFATLYGIVFLLILAKVIEILNWIKKKKEGL